MASNCHRLGFSALHSRAAATYDLLRQNPPPLWGHQCVHDSSVPGTTAENHTCAHCLGCVCPVIGAAPVKVMRPPHGQMLKTYPTGSYLYRHRWIQSISLRLDFLIWKQMASLMMLNRACDMVPLWFSGTLKLGYVEKANLMTSSPSQNGGKTLGSKLYNLITWSYKKNSWSTRRAAMI